MNRRKRAIELDNRIESKLLDSIWDNALLGIGYDSHTKEVFPVYGYQVMKAMLIEKGISPIAIFEILKNIQSQQAIILKRINTNSMWKLVKARRIPAWEYLDKAAIAIHNDKLCYLSQLCEEILKASGTRIYGETEFDETLRIRQQFETNIKNADLGEQSPIFITIIK